MIYSCIEISLPFPAGEKLKFAFGGEMATKLARLLGRVTSQPLESVEHIVGMDVVITSDSIGHDSVEGVPYPVTDPRFPVECFADENCFRVYLSPRGENSVNGIPLLRLFLILAVRNKCRKKMEVGILHGAILKFPDVNACAIVFAESGVGKSTTSRRWHSQGGDWSADDQLILSGNSRQGFFAQPLPTWSAFDKNTRVDTATPLQVRALLRLCRGKLDQVCDDDEGLFRVQLIKSLMFHQAVPLFDAGKIRCVFENNCDFALALQKYFGSHSLQGDLDGSVFQNVLAFLSA